MSHPPVIVWFRQDLRLTDQPALRAAADSGRPVLPIYLHSPDGEGDWQLGGASKVYLHHALHHLDTSLRRLGSRLIVRRADRAIDAILSIIEQTGADTVHACSRYEPAAIARDASLTDALQDRGVEMRWHTGSLMFEPGDIRTQQGKPYTVFTPYYRKCLAMPPVRSPLSEPTSLHPLEEWPASDTIDDLHLLPSHAWHETLAGHIHPSEHEALADLDRFCTDAVTRYNDERDRPDMRGTSALSSALHFGLLSPHTVWARAIEARKQASAEARQQIDGYLRQLVWREFAHHLLVHFPHTATQPLRETFAAFPWADNDEALQRWQRGRTGYPIVDAGMRQLWQTGWMHNRVRMIVASFLCKHLLIHWHHGARWFWDTLVDADLANNTLGWQWTAGCGADAQPYFRIFNPYTQAAKFDPSGDYIRRWVPELADFDPPDIYDPPPLMRPADYPEPMVDHKHARDSALAAYETIKSK